MSAGSDKDKGSGALTPRDATVADTQPTPGPWRVFDDDWGAIKVADGTLVADTNPHFGKRQASANARLIAAAPELKEALQNMLGAFDNAVRRMKMPGDFEDEAIATARIALAKTQPPAKAGEAKQ